MKFKLVVRETWKALRDAYFANEIAVRITVMNIPNSNLVEAILTPTLRVHMMHLEGEKTDENGCTPLRPECSYA